MIKNYFKIAWRNLWRHKQMAAINVIGLSVGMAATVLIALWVQNELSFDNYYPDVKNVYRITSHIAISKDETWNWETSQYILGDHAVHDIPEIAGITRIIPAFGDITVKYNGALLTEPNSAYVDSNWFNMFPQQFTHGSQQAFLKDPFGVVLTEKAANRYFGNEDPIGQVFRIDTLNYQVRGVVANNPANSSFQFDFILSTAAHFYDPTTRKNDMEWGNFNYITFLKLNSRANIKAVQHKLAAINIANNKYAQKDDGKITPYTLANLTDIHFEKDLMSSKFLHGNRIIVDIFVVLAVLLLVTACINYVNLTTARASIRSKEVSVRKIVGAARGQLFGQFMSESFLVSAISLLFAVVLVQTCMPWFRTFTQKDFANPVTSPLAWQIIVGTLLLSFLLNGIYPAVLLSSFKPLNIFRGKNLLNFKDGALRKALVVVQFSISVVLIIGTIVIYAQLHYIQTLDPGYSRSQVLTMDIPWQSLGTDRKAWPSKLEAIKNELKSQSSIADVANGNRGVVDNQSTSAGNFDWDGRPKDLNPSFARFDADDNFQHLLHIRMKEGRWFRSDGSDKKNVVLNETAVAVMNLRKPYLNQRIVHNGDTGILVGITYDFHYRSLHDKIGAALISNHPSTCFYIKTRAGQNQAATRAAGKVWSQFIPDRPFTYAFLDDAYNNLYKTEQRSSALITVFAIIAVVVSALGLLGLSAFAAEQKVKEIGIRKVLGASVQNIVALLSADFLKMILIACLVAFPVAWWAMNKWLQEFAYRINVSWWILVLSGAIALVIAFVTISFQAVKAATANPVNSLRSE